MLPKSFTDKDFRARLLKYSLGAVFGKDINSRHITLSLAIRQNPHPVRLPGHKVLLILYQKNFVSNKKRLNLCLLNKILHYEQS